MALYRAYRGLLQETLRLMRAATDDGRLCRDVCNPKPAGIDTHLGPRACRVRYSHRTCFWLISHGLVLHYSAWSRPSPSGLLTTRRPARPSATTKSQAPFRGLAFPLEIVQSSVPVSHTPLANEAQGSGLGRRAPRAPLG